MVELLKKLHAELLSDGKLDPKDKKILEQKQKELSALIFKLKHNKAKSKKRRKVANNESAEQ